MSSPASDRKRTAWRRYHGRRAAARAVIRNPALSKIEQTQRLSRLLNPTTRPRIIVIAAGMRTGSTILCELAQALPEVETTYEALNPIAYGWMKLTGPTEAADLTRDLSLRGPTTVTKVFRSHLQAMNTDWNDYAKALPEALWLQLYRHDVVSQFVSLQQARTSDQWLETDTTAVEKPAVHLNLDHLRQHYTTVVEDDRAAFDAISQTTNYSRIRYEDFASNPATWGENTLPELLGVTGGPVRHALKRQDNRDLGQRVINPEAIAEAEHNGLRWHPAASWQ